MSVGRKFKKTTAYEDYLNDSEVFGEPGESACILSEGDDFNLGYLDEPYSQDKWVQRFESTGSISFNIDDIF